MTDINIPRPELGRPSDKRVTAEFLQARNLNGPAFDPTRDVDVLDAVEDALVDLHALVAYADPELGPALQELVVEAEQSLADIAQSTAGLQAAAAGAVPYVNLAAFPAANLYNGKSAWATDTGFVYKSDGAAWVKTGEVATPGAVQAASTAAASALAQANLLAGDFLLSASVAAIPNTAGTYRVTQGIDAGQVHQRLGNGTLVRLNGLEAMSVGGLESRDGVNVLDYRLAADGFDIAPAVLRAAQKLGAGVVRLAPGQIYTWSTNITIPAAVAVLATGAVIQANPAALLPRDALINWDAGASGGLIERVQIQGGAWYGNGYIGKIGVLKGSGTVTPGTVRGVSITHTYAEGFNDQFWRIGADGDATSNFVVEDVLYAHSTAKNGGLLNRITATGANGASTLTLTTQDEFPLASKLGMGAGLRFKLGGGPEIYTITTYNAAAGTVAITPALTRAVTDAWMYTQANTFPTASGTAGQTAVTLASASAEMMPGMRLAFFTCPGQYVVSSVAGTTVTLTAPLLGTFVAQRIFNGAGETGNALYLGAETRRATVFANVCRGMSANFMGKQGDKRPYTKTSDGDFVLLANRIGYVRMAFESAALGTTASTGTRPTATGTAGGTVLTVTNNGGAGTFASRGWTVNSLINVARIPGLYRITAVDDAAGTITVTRYNLTTRADLTGGLTESVTAANLWMVETAAGMAATEIGGHRVIVVGNILDEITCESNGYFVSWGANQVVLSDNIVRITERTAIECSAENISGGNNTYLIRKWLPGMIAPQSILTTPNCGWLVGHFNSGTLTGDTVTFDGFASSDVVQPFGFYARNGFAPQSTGFTLSHARITGFTRFFSLADADARADHLRLDDCVFDAPLCTNQFQVRGRGWRVTGGQMKLGAGLGVFIAPSGVLASIVDGALDFAVKRVEVQNRAALIDATLTANTRLVNNEYLSGGVWAYDIPAGTPPLPGYLTKAAAVLGLDPKAVFVDNWRTKADSATLTAPVVGSGYGKIIFGGAGDWSISGGKATLATAAQLIAFEPQIGGVAISRADADVSWVIGGSGEASLRFRVAADNSEYLVFGANNYQDGVATSAEYILSKRAGGVTTRLWGSNIGTDGKIGDEVRVVYVGSLIKLYVNDVLRATITEAALTTNTRLFLLGFNNGTRAPALKDFIVRTP
ncbi:hypothetical protein E7T06_07350 [Deinococcus sp. Arct2-2]|uniref:hypothetical protein n=1 Tax=Deinococcus sp. Arct2-2 TaxID=2568653 RepID=UPI0010A45D3C|nr:hypothetical protein [Deinococcus sp. Arct2-2]THF70513.1 hypothetical protein E7T06_07350 [Deinococcus sp. Arct2-2]